MGLLGNRRGIGSAQTTTSGTLIGVDIGALISVGNGNNPTFSHVDFSAALAVALLHPQRWQQHFQRHPCSRASFHDPAGGRLGRTWLSSPPGEITPALLKQQ